MIDFLFLYSRTSSLISFPLDWSWYDWSSSLVPSPPRFDWRLRIYNPPEYLEAHGWAKYWHSSKKLGRFSCNRNCIHSPEVFYGRRLLSSKDTRVLSFSSERLTNVWPLTKLDRLYTAVGANQYWMRATVSIRISKAVLDHWRWTSLLLI